MDKDYSKVYLKEIIFLIKDIFDYIRKNANEPDKITTMSHEINWEDYPDLLKNLINNRFKHILNLGSYEEIEDKAWKAFFDFNHKGKKHPYEVIREIITNRPRDLIYFVSCLFESAINKEHERVNKEDLNYAITNYTKFLNSNLIAETKAEFPEIEDILAKLQEHHGKKIEYGKFCKIVRNFGYDLNQIGELVKTLFDKGYMIGFDENTDKPFSDLELLKNKLKEKRWFIFKNKVYVIAHAKYYYIRDKQFSSF